MTQGRPKKEIKREYSITLWLTEEELNTLNAFCEEWGYNRGNVARVAIMHYIQDWRKVK